MESPDCYLLARIQWNLFGTLTYLPRDWDISRSRQLKTWMAFARIVCKRSGVHFTRAVWGLRREAGELNGKPHLHFLFGSLPTGHTGRSTRFALMNQWESLGCGMARIRQYDNSLAGVDYVSKCLGGHVAQGANAYEFQKFGTADELMLSQEAERQLRVWSQDCVRPHRKPEQPRMA